MTKSLLSRLCLSLTLTLLASACGNVRFTSGTSSSGVAGAAGTLTGGNDGGGGTTGTTGTNTGGNDGGYTTPGNPPPSGPRTVTYNSTVPPVNNQVDILLVVDNSSSMAIAQKQLGSQLNQFATTLSNLNIDWQMCMTVTTFSTIGGTCQPSTCLPNVDNPSGADLCYTSTCVGNACTGNCSGGTQYWGTSYPWQGYTPPAGATQYILKPGTSNLANIFSSTVQAVGDTDLNTGDERGIKAAFNHFANAQANVANAGGCYRQGSSVAVIVLSNEDERSVGGNYGLLNAKDSVQLAFYNPNGANLALDSQESPAALVSQAANIFGSGTRFVFNSIVVEDATCQTQQDTTPDPNTNLTSFSYLGNQYLATSALTNGGTGSICSSDFSNTMNVFAQQINQVNSMATFTLECAPVSGTLQVTVNGAASTAYTVSGATLTFNPALVSGQTLGLTYNCAN